ncbi:pyruvate formate lyase activating enzyme [Rhodoblastus acidophilus]|uniref:pyruvate formate-lyase-activating protein n=1 Tax=Rhodoblastus acidophilus TaxID=1074 RepID=UPI0022245DE9|nr:pyruvate formate-lyase-activating protein [Rhodoblastus acidophilus]MCW2286455.1 pyruvate formate lyase activating enzyme [Rhodoblastus acidophilus]MCW2335304.1 pyruvate formate lyase activating enzyme [Rhodoblastus acidophilus]
MSHIALRTRAAPDSALIANWPDHADPVGYLHSVETGAAADGPGMRFIYFVAGCPLRCLYCHNPDTWKFASGRVVTLDDAIEEIRPYAHFLRKAGGVTISGGEPLTQRNFVGRLLLRLRDELGLHTALDTQGFLGHKVSDAWLDAVDLVLLDVKHADPGAYRLITSRALQPTLDFGDRLTRLRKPMWIRYVLVPGLTDAPADLEKLADTLLPWGEAIQRVEVLPYHRMGAPKWLELGRSYPLGETRPPTAENLAAAIDLLRRRGLPAF